MGLSFTAALLPVFLRVSKGLGREDGPRKERRPCQDDVKPPGWLRGTVGAWAVSQIGLWRPKTNLEGKTLRGGFLWWDGPIKFLLPFPQVRIKWDPFFGYWYCTSWWKSHIAFCSDSARIPLFETGHTHGTWWAVARCRVVGGVERCLSLSLSPFPHLVCFSSSVCIA